MPASPWDRPGSLVVPVVLVPLLLSACASPVDGGPPEVDPGEVLERAEQQRADLPLLVPTELPEGWRLDAANGDGQGERTVTQELTFVSEDLSAGPVVVCVQRATDQQERCSGAFDAEGGERVEDVVGVIVVPDGEDEARQDWSDVQLTPDWRDLDWLRRGGAAKG